MGQGRRRTITNVDRGEVFDEYGLHVLIARCGIIGIVQFGPYRRPDARGYACAKLLCGGILDRRDDYFVGGVHLIHSIEHLHGVDHALVHLGRERSLHFTKLHRAARVFPTLAAHRRGDLFLYTVDHDVYLYTVAAYLVRRTIGVGVRPVLSYSRVVFGVRSDYYAYGGDGIQSDIHA